MDIKPRKKLTHNLSTNVGNANTTGSNLGQLVDLSSLRTVSSTGSVLNANVCQWFYDHAFPPTVHLASGSGGTDLACARK